LIGAYYDQKCRTCEKRAASRCGKCHIAYYCNVKCQQQDWRNHKNSCTPIKTTNSADCLVKAALSDVFPEELDACNDFGFSKCYTQDQKSNLLGLYIGLISTFGVGSKELHQWQQANELALHIRKIYEDAGTIATSNYYYRWFLRYQHIVDSRTPEADGFQLVRKYLSPEDKDKNFDQLQPDAKRITVGLYLTLLAGTVPSINQEIWILFGFCTCKNIVMEGELGRVYRALIDKCTLYEFYTNYVSDSLEDLLRSKNISGIDSLKAQGVVFGRQTIGAYRLKQYVLTEHVPLQRSVGEDYGFSDYGFNLCRNKKEIQKLRKIYKQLFEHKDFDILRLHEACISGTIYEYANQFVDADANLMRNR
jgi:hypothetical protein